MAAVVEGFLQFLVIVQLRVW